MEAVTNALKHARCTRIEVTLSALGPTGVRFAVKDDGQGFDTAASRSGTGLAGMSDRLGVFNGGVTVNSCPGEGTTVVGVAFEGAVDVAKGDDDVAASYVTTG
jgi:signal transduction histidine kinase